MAKIATMTLTGKSGTKYGFNVYPRSDEFNAIGAVYFMTKRVENQLGKGTHTWVYVGETGDLSDRPLNHERSHASTRMAQTACLFTPRKIMICA